MECDNLPNPAPISITVEDFFKISSKKNSYKIYLKNVVEVTIEYFKKLNIFKIINLINIILISMVYLILTIKNNAKRY